MAQQAQLQWRDGGVPVSTRFDDPYFSLENGVDETRHVFLGGNDLPGRLRDGFHIAELGFGTGLNLLATLEAWGERPGAFRYTSFEAYPMGRDDMARALSAFAGIGPFADLLLAAWREEGGEMQVGPARLEVVVGDARETLPLPAERLRPTRRRASSAVVWMRRGLTLNGCPDMGANVT